MSSPSSPKLTLHDRRPRAHDRACDTYRGEAGATYFATLDADDFTQNVIARERARKIQPHVGPNDRVLEYGVGSGYNLRFVRAGERSGYDLNEAGRAACEAAGIRFTQAIDSLPPRSFDVVICHHVLEHVPDPLETIEQLESLTRPGGRVLVFVPFETRRRYRRYEPDDPNHHLYSWNAQSLGNLLAQSSLQLDELAVRPFSYERRLAPLARVGAPLYHLGLRVLRGLRTEDELCATLSRPDVEAAGAFVPRSPVVRRAA